MKPINFRVIRESKPDSKEQLASIHTMKMLETISEGLPVFIQFDKKGIGTIKILDRYCGESSTRRQ